MGGKETINRHTSNILHCFVLDGRECEIAESVLWGSMGAVWRVMGNCPEGSEAQMIALKVSP